MFSNGDRKMAANMANSTVPKEEVISSLDRRVYRAMTEEVPRKRSRVNGGNSSNVEEELSIFFFKLTVLVHSLGGGGTLFYGLFTYVRLQRVWFFSRFGHK